MAKLLARTVLGLCANVSLLIHFAASVAPDARPQDTDPAFNMPHLTIYRESGGMQCGLNHTSDLYRPIPTVLHEHPGVDGYCYFEFHAPWMSYTQDSLSIPDYLPTSRAAVEYMRSLPEMCPSDPGRDQGALILEAYRGDHGPVFLRSHVDCMHMMGDDVYCHAMGWARNQRLNYSLITNGTAWRELAHQECDRFQATYNFTDEEITLGRHIDDQATIFVYGRQRSLVLHGYHKCLLGHAAEEMAYCQTLVCELADGTIGHNGWCGDEPYSVVQQ